MKLSTIEFISPVRDPDSGRLVSRYNLSAGTEIEVFDGYVKLTAKGVSLLTTVAWHSGVPVPEPTADLVVDVQKQDTRPAQGQVSRTRTRKAKATKSKS